MVSSTRIFLALSLFSSAHWPQTAWSTTGCTVAAQTDAAFVVCACTHLTAFNMRLATPPLPVAEAPVAQSDAAAAASSSSSLVPVVVGVVAALGGLAAAFALYKYCAKRSAAQKAAALVDAELTVLDNIGRDKSDGATSASGSGDGGYNAGAGNSRGAGMGGDIEAGAALEMAHLPPTISSNPLFAASGVAASAVLEVGPVPPTLVPHRSHASAALTAAAEQPASHMPPSLAQRPLFSAAADNVAPMPLALVSNQMFTASAAEHSPPALDHSTFANQGAAANVTTIDNSSADSVAHASFAARVPMHPPASCNIEAVVAGAEQPRAPNGEPPADMVTAAATQIQIQIPTRHDHAPPIEIAAEPQPQPQPQSQAVYSMPPAIGAQTDKPAMPAMPVRQLSRCAPPPPPPPRQNSIVATVGAGGSPTTIVRRPSLTGGISAAAIAAAAADGSLAPQLSARRQTSALQP
jgi:hypothetical protein